jgi:hypothetical protein
MSERRGGLETPVALIIFNRPAVTARVLEAIAKVRPQRLFVIADGPREGHPTDAVRCAETRQLLAKIDWDCQVRPHFSEVNLGCKRRPETGLDWLFEQVPEAIILEDDCLPSTTFFGYCESLLAHYRDDRRVMMIGGFNPLGSIGGGAESYCHSMLGSTWGWATWRRAWLLHDPWLTSWPEVVATRLIDRLFPDSVQTRYWYDVFARILDGRLADAWDYQWLLSCWLQSGYRLLPAVSMIANLGFGDEATHTFGKAPFREVPGEMIEPLVHPRHLVRRNDLDWAITDLYCQSEGFLTTWRSGGSVAKR